MRKLMSMLLALCLVLAMVPVAASAEGNPTITIDGKETTYTDLQTAVSAADEGDTINLPAGTYKLSSVLSIEKAVSLVGDSAGGTIIVGPVQYAIAKDEKSPKTVSIKNLTIKSDSTLDTIQGLRFYGVFNGGTSTAVGANVTIEGCTFEGWTYGVTVNTYAQNYSLTIDNCTFNSWCAVSARMGDDNNNTVNFTGNNTISEGGYAMQAFNNDYSLNGYYSSTESYEQDLQDGLNQPDVDATKVAQGYYVTNADELTAAVNKADNGATIILAAGNFTLNNTLTISKRINLIGSGVGETTIDGPVQYKFSENQAGNDFTVSGITFKANTNNSTVQGLQFCGNQPNEDYDVNISVTDCAFDGWTYGITMNSHANGCNMTVTGCTFTDCLYAVSYNYDTTTAGQEADNSLQFGEGNIISEGCFAVQKFNNINTGEGMVDKTYATIEAFENDESTISGHVIYVTSDLGTAISNAADGSTLIVAPGEYGGDNITFDGKSLTIKAQYPAYKDGVKADEDKLSKFEGTFNTYDGSNSFNENQTVVIEGIAFSGNGLKIGNCNYNSVGNLEVRYCTMECGGNLSTANSYNQYNYFVKTSGDNGQGTDAFASVTVEDNYITGTLAENVTPIQLWRVDKAIVRNNVINVQGGEDHQAINVSKMAEDAEVEITDNDISGTEGGIYVTNWLLNGGKSNGNSWTDDESLTFEGKISVTDNDLNVSATGEGENPVYPIFVGPETATQADVGGIYDVVGNTNKDEPVEAVIGKRENSQVQLFTATFKDGNVVVGTISGAPTDGSLTITLPEALTKSGYTFGGWNNGKTTTAAGNEAKITEDTTFTAVWNASSIGGGSTEEPEEPALPFTDVKTGDWFYEHVLYVYENNIMAGMSETTFEPLTTLDRAQAVQMLYNLEGQPEVTGEMDFTDVETSDWWSNAVAWASQNGVVAGYEDETFRPERKVTREEFAQMLYNYAEYKGYDLTASANLSKYPDAGKISGWAETAMAWANGNGLINGHDNGMIDPIGTATRAQAASILANFDKNIVTE